MAELQIEKSTVITQLEGSVFVISMALFPKSTIKPQLPQPQVTVTLGAF
jgi:hypothetical protein